MPSSDVNWAPTSRRQEPRTTGWCTGLRDARDSEIRPADWIDCCLGSGGAIRAAAWLALAAADLMRA